MEILLGIILLLQIVILIQIMLAQKQMLQRIGELVVRIDCIKNDIGKRTEAAREIQQETAKNEPKISNKPDNTDQLNQEALINEVLSEVFS